MTTCASRLGGAIPRAARIARAASARLRARSSAPSRQSALASVASAPARDHQIRGHSCLLEKRFQGCPSLECRPPADRSTEVRRAILARCRMRRGRRARGTRPPLTHLRQVPPLGSVPADVQPDRRRRCGAAGAAANRPPLNQRLCAFRSPRMLEGLRSHAARWSHRGPAAPGQAQRFERHVAASASGPG